MNIDLQCKEHIIPKENTLPMIEQPIDTEFLIPEYCPDISKILKCYITPRLVSKNINGKSLEIEGSAEITVIFCGENNKISSVITKYNFTKTIEDKSFENNEVSVLLSNGHLSCRQTSSRRIEIRASVNIEITTIEQVKKDIYYNVDRKDIQILRDLVPATTEIGYTEKILLIEEDLIVNNIKGEIKSIIRNTSKVVVNECKIVGQKAVVKGELKIFVTYCTTDDFISYFYESIPFSQLIEVKAEGSDCTSFSSAEICSLEIKPVVSTDKSQGFQVIGKINLFVKTYCESEIPLIKDLFSTKTCITTNTDSLKFKKKIESISEKAIVKKVIKLNDNQLSGVLDFWCDVIKKEPKKNDNEITFNGSINGCLLFETIENMPEIIDVKFDFEYNKLLTSDIKGEVYINQNIIPLNCSYTITSSNQIEVQVELLIQAEIYEIIEKDFITEIIDTDEKIYNGESIIIYFSNENENIWDISKKFSTSPQRLKDENNITEEKINKPTVLIIPRM